MKTKREQIEEITSIIDSDICDKDCSNRCPYCGGLSSREAEKIYNAGYRKVGKDEIVVKKSEQKQWLKDCIESNKKTEEIARKETAREILDMLYDMGIDKEMLECCRISDVNGVSLAKQIYEAGYGDVSEYKAEIERLRQEVRDTDKMARNTIEQYRAENEELENALKQSEDNYSRAFERLKAQWREIGKLKDENEALKNDLINSDGNLSHITTEIERLKEETSNIRKETAREILSRIKLYATDSKTDLIDLIDEIANANGVEVEE